MVQCGQEMGQGGQFPKKTAAVALMDGAVDDSAQRLGRHVLEHQQVVDFRIEPIGADHIVRPGGQAQAAQEKEVVEFGFTRFAGLVRVGQFEKLADQLGASVYFLVQIDVAGVGELEDPVTRIGRRKAQLGCDVVLQIPVQGVFPGKLSEVTADHRFPRYRIERRCTSSSS